MRALFPPFSGIDARRSERGTAALESLLGLSLLIVVISGGLIIMYLSFARASLNRATYEAAVCLATDARVNTCSRTASATLERALPLGTFEITRLVRSSFSAEAEIEYHLDRYSLKKRERLRLPLTSTGTKVSHAW